MAGQAQGNAQGQVVKGKAVPRGGYVQQPLGNQGPANVIPRGGQYSPGGQTIGQAPGGFAGPITAYQQPNLSNLSKFGGGKSGYVTPEYLKGFNPTGPQTMDSRQYTLNGQNMTGGSSYIAALTKHLNSIGQGGLLKGGLYTPSTQTPPPKNIAPLAPGVAPPVVTPPGGQAPVNPPVATIAPQAPVTPQAVPTPAPPSINQMAVSGLKAAGAGTAAAMGYTPNQVSVAGTSSSVAPTSVTGSNVTGTNVAGTNVNPTNYNVTGSNVNPALNAVTGSNVAGSNVAGTNVAGSNIAAQQIGQQAQTPQVQAQMLRNTSMTPYMNQYDDAVVKANELDILRGANMGLDMLGTQAQMAGGFGGSRHGIAMGELGRGTVEQLAQSSAGLRQAGYQNAQQMAGQDIANNFQSQMANQAGSQFDINTNMQGALANQGAGLQASQANQQNRIQAGLANQGNALQAGLANQQNSLQSQGMNQQNSLQAQGMNQQYGMQGQLANQSNALQAQGMNQQYGMQGALANQGNALQAGLANQGNNMQGQLSNQSNALQSQGMNQQYNMQGQLANQNAGMQDIQNQLQASLANQNAGLQGNQQLLGGAAQMGNVANLGFNMGQTVNNNLAMQGAQQQAMQQALIDAAKAQFMGYTGQGANTLGYVNNALGQTPNVGTVTQQQTKQNGIFDYLTAMSSMSGGGA